MVYTLDQIRSIHGNATAVSGRSYTDTSGNVYAGQKNGRLKKVQDASSTTFNPTLSISANDTQQAIEEVSDEIQAQIDSLVLSSHPPLTLDTNINGLTIGVPLQKIGLNLANNLSAGALVQLPAANPNDYYLRGDNTFQLFTAGQFIDSILDTSTIDLDVTAGVLTANFINAAGYITGNQSITLSGEVTGSGATAITATLTNSAVIGKILTGYVSGAGTVASTDTILEAIQKINGNVAGILAGDVESVNGLTGIVPLTGTSNKITISASNVFNIGSDVVTLTGSQALSNKTGNISQWTNDSGYLTTLSGALLIANNLSDVASAGTSRTNLGATTVGANIFTLTNPSAITFIRINADNTVTALSDSDFRTAIGAGTGAGTVTDVLWTTSQGVSASIATSTTTPNITVTLGALTGVTSFNGLVVTANTGAITTGTWTGTSIALANGGTNAALTASNGGILYSTASAGAILSGTATAGLALISGASTAPSWFAPTAGSVIFAGTSGILQQDNANLFFDDTNNRLGIGVTTPTNILSLGNAAARKIWIENSATTVVGRALTVSAGGTVAGGTNTLGGELILQAGLGTGTGASTITFQTGLTLATGTTLQTMTTAMTILGSGNVGIDRPNPLSKLHILGDFQISAATGITTYKTSFDGGIYKSNSGGASLPFTDTNNMIIQGHTAGRDIDFVTGTTPATRMYITRTGSIGIGTISPTANLHIAQTATATGALVGLRYVGAVNTNQTLSTEIPSVTLTTAGREWAAGAITLQREVIITAPTYTAVSASTITDAVGFAVTAPVASTNITITRNWAAQFTGNFAVSGNTRFGSLTTAPTVAVDVTGAILATTFIRSSGATSGIGYTTGAGSTGSQATSRTTTVTLNFVCGTITMFSAAQAANELVTFTFTNSAIAATDYLLVQHISATDGGAWNISVVCSAGSATINIRNVSTASITSATPLRFLLIKSVTS